MFDTIYNFFASCNNLNPLGKKGFYGTKNTVTPSQKHFQATLELARFQTFPYEWLFVLKLTGLTARPRPLLNLFQLHCDKGVARAYQLKKGTLTEKNSKAHLIVLLKKQICHHSCHI